MCEEPSAARRVRTRRLDSSMAPTEHIHPFKIARAVRGLSASDAAPSKSNVAEQQSDGRIAISGIRTRRGTADAIAATRAADVVIAVNECPVAETSHDTNHAETPTAEVHS